MLISKSFGENRIIKAYKVIKITPKCMSIKEVIINNNIPTEEFKERTK